MDECCMTKALGFVLGWKNGTEHPILDSPIWHGYQVEHAQGDVLLHHRLDAFCSTPSFILFSSSVHGLLKVTSHSFILCSTCHSLSLTQYTHLKLPRQGSRS